MVRKMGGGGERSVPLVIVRGRGKRNTAHCSSKKKSEWKRKKQTRKISPKGRREKKKQQRGVLIERERSDQERGLICGATAANKGEND